MDREGTNAQSNDGSETEITGVVSRVIGSKEPNDELWSLGLVLNVWRQDAGELCRDDLYVRGPLTREALDGLRAELPPFQVTRLIVRIGKASEGNRLEATLVRVVDLKASDAELESISLESQKPVYLNSDKFGPLVLDRVLGRYQGKVQTGAGQVSLSLEPYELEQTRVVVSLAERMWKSLRDWDNQARQRAVEDLLPTKNVGWLDEGEPEVTPEAFINSMSLSGINLAETGDLEFYYDDGGLFWGHCIGVFGSLDGGMESSNLFG